MERTDASVSSCEDRRLNKLVIPCGVCLRPLLSERVAVRQDANLRRSASSHADKELRQLNREDVGYDRESQSLHSFGGTQMTKDLIRSGTAELHRGIKNGSRT